MSAKKKTAEPKATPRATTQAWGKEDLLAIDGDTWAFQGGGPALSIDNVCAKNGVGAYAPASTHTHNQKEEATLVYLAQILGPAAVPASLKLGGTAGTGWNVTQIKIGTENTGHAKLEVTIHRHPVSTNGHMENQVTVAFPTFNGYGAADFLESGLGEDIQSSSITYSIEHVDKQNNIGDHLVGRSQGAKMEGDLKAVTDTADPDVGGDWKRTGRTLERSNEDFYGVSLQGIQYLEG
jgi:hypothetical protein